MNRHPWEEGAMVPEAVAALGHLDIFGMQLAAHSENKAVCQWLPDVPWADLQRECKPTGHCGRGRCCQMPFSEHPMGLLDSRTCL